MANANILRFFVANSPIILMAALCCSKTDTILDVFGTNHNFKVSYTKCHQFYSVLQLILSCMNQVCCTTTNSALRFFVAAISLQLNHAEETSSQRNLSLCFLKPKLTSTYRHLFDNLQNALKVSSICIRKDCPSTLFMVLFSSLCLIQFRTHT